jgi:hypothetical protein
MGQHMTNNECITRNRKDLRNLSYFIIPAGYRAWREGKGWFISQKKLSWCERLRIFLFGY